MLTHLADARHTRYQDQDGKGEINFPAAVPELAGIGNYPYAFVVNGLGGSPPIPSSKLIYSTQIYPWNQQGERLPYFWLYWNANRILLLPVFMPAKFERLPPGKVDVSHAPPAPHKGAAMGWHIAPISVKQRTEPAQIGRICHSCGKQCEGCSVGAEPFVYNQDKTRTNIGLN